jgi:hypothetical protein
MIARAVWLYYRFPLVLRHVEEMLLQRGIAIRVRRLPEDAQLGITLFGVPPSRLLPPLEFCGGVKPPRVPGLYATLESLDCPQF